MKKFKVGVIGTGYIGMVHLEILRRITEADVIAVADTNHDLAQAAAEKYSIPRVYTSVDKMVDDADVEIVHNCTPNNVHFASTSKLIKAGKDVLSEKPLALNSKESGELVRLAEEQGTVTGINFCYRYYPVVQEAAARVRGGDLGDLRACMGHFLQDWLFFDTDYSWRLDPEFSGKTNVVGDLGSHWCDLVQFITGRKITEVMAELHTCIPKRKKPKKQQLAFSTPSDDDYEDFDVVLDEFAALLMRFDNGARGTFTTCQVAAGKKVDIDLQVYGSKKSYGWNHVHPNALWVGYRDRANETFYESSQYQTGGTGRYMTLPTGHPMGYHDAMYNLVRDYYDAVSAKREGKPFEVDIPDFMAGHREMCIIDAAVRSAETGTWAKVAD